MRIAIETMITAVKEVSSTPPVIASHREASGDVFSGRAGPLLRRWNGNSQHLFIDFNSTRIRDPLAFTAMVAKRAKAIRFSSEKYHYGADKEEKMSRQPSSSTRAEPLAFEFGLGSYGSESFELAWNGEAVEYRRFGPGFVLRDTRIVKPSAEDWRRFREWLDRDDVWQWPDSFPGPPAPGGKGNSWTVHIELGGKELVSSGAGAYPGGHGSDRSPAFERFIAALRRLLGGLELR